MQLGGNNSGRVRGAIALALGSLLCMILAVIAFSSIGATALFRLGVLLTTEAVDTTDTAYLEYYDLKSHTDHTDGYRLFISPNHSLSYDAVLDFLKFIKQNAAILTVRLDLSAAGNISDASALNTYLEDGDPSGPNGVSDPLRGFIRAVYAYNQTLPPQARVTFAVGGDAGTGELILTDKPYAETAGIPGILAIHCVYPGTDGCDPLFDVSFGTIRFGRLADLGFYSDYLGLVSGNFGFPAFTGVTQSDYYFLLASD